MALLALLLALAISAPAQTRTGTLDILAQDASGAPIAARVTLRNDATGTRRESATTPGQPASFRALPFNTYQVTVSAPGLAPRSDTITITTAVPQQRQVTLAPSPVQTTVDVAAGATLTDTQATLRQSLGRSTIDERRFSLPARALLELVQTQPGWLLEANGVLHPRGSEYDTQYVLDGFPLTDNRSPSFAPALDVETAEAVRVLTAGIPAEYGRKLGGIVEISTPADPRPGVHGQGSFQVGRYGTVAGAANSQVRLGRQTLAAFADAAVTDRYLDPPALENFTNRGRVGGAGLRHEWDLTSRDRLRLLFQKRRSAFLVPNDPEQEEAGQRQDRTGDETLGQASYQRVLSPSTLLQARWMGRDVAAELWSNPFAEPIAASQDRGFREHYGSVAVSRAWRAHEFKAGTEVIATRVREQFAYQLTDPDDFDDEVPVSFQFAGRARGREVAGYVQDDWRMGNLRVSAGLRWDRYRLLVRETAWSPRLGAAWHVPSQGVTFRVSYDRVFQSPPIENLLVASSTEAQRLSDDAVALPVPPARGHFVQAGLTKTFAGRVRLDAHWFRRSWRNFADDDLILNTGVAIPVTFDGAAIHGAEAQLLLPSWRGWMVRASYSYLQGTARLPVTGGLLVEEDAADLLRARGEVPITQDQRHTAYGRVQRQVTSRVFLAAAAWYGSGLPFELADDPEYDEIDPRVLRRVNLERGRVRPSWSLDLHASWSLWQRETTRIRFQVDAQNVTNRLNVINFDGALSGTALAPGRTIAGRLNWAF